MANILSTFESLHSSSKKLAAEASLVFPSGVTHDARAFEPFPIYVEKAQGARKWDVDGNEIVDYIGGHGSLLLGHNHPEVIENIQKTLLRGTHFGSSHDLEVAWGQQVLKMVPCGEKLRFTSSGTEATMMALRLARAYTGREKIVKLSDHFHGWHDIVVGKQSNDESQPQSLGVPDSFYESLIIIKPNDIENLSDVLAKNEIAAVILEPTGAHWGEVPLDPGYLQKVRALTKENNTLMIMDEVITGFRMAPGGAQEYYNVLPDLSTHAKIVAGGLPGGCVTGREEIINILEMNTGGSNHNSQLQDRVAHQGTYNANPVSAAAGLTALKIISAENVNEQANLTTKKLVNGLNDIFRQSSVPGSAWGISSMWHFNLGYEAPFPNNVEWDAKEAPRGVPDKKLMQALRWSLFNHGVDLMSHGGMVSAAHGDKEVDDTLTGFTNAIADLRSEKLLA